MRVEILRKYALNIDLASRCFVKADSFIDVCFVHGHFNEQKVEKFLSDLVTNGTVQAKTDRPLGIVCFAPHRHPDSVLNDWSNNLNKLMSLVNKTTHLVNKEEMVHKHLLATVPK